METNPVQKFAVIINGDTEKRHLKNVDRAARVLEREDYDLYVASSQRPKRHVDHYTRAALADVQKLLEGLRSKIDNNDKLVIYTTGHGWKEGDVGSLCLEDGCKSEPISSLLDTLPYGQRTVIMDQCYSGNWNKIFLDNPKTLFIAAGSQDQQVCCGEVAPYFWSSHVPDLNGDGGIDWQERYAYVLENGPPSASIPQFVSSAGYLLQGLTPVAPREQELEPPTSEGGRRAFQHSRQSVAVVSVNGQMTISIAGTCGSDEDVLAVKGRVIRDNCPSGQWVNTQSNPQSDQCVNGAYKVFLEGYCRS